LKTDFRPTSPALSRSLNALTLLVLAAWLSATGSPRAAQEPTTSAKRPGSLPAFPGAEGFGATTPGGRGGKVFFVTNLQDSGPGSLRAACEAEVPRIVVFQVGGLIRLKSDLVVSHPYLTLAGQTAPGDGICLRDFPFIVATHDVIVRYLRSRLGDESRQQADCIDLAHGASHVVLDHCSATWAVDEGLSLSGRVADVTVQWCLIGESLNQSLHTKGEHGYGSLARANGAVSLHHNLWIHNLSRNPRLGDNYGKPPYPTFDVRNNVIYDFGKVCTGLTQGRLEINYVANYIRPGPDSSASHPISVGLPSDLRFFIHGNVLDGDEAKSEDNREFFSLIRNEEETVVTFTEDEFPAPLVSSQSADAALTSVLASVGASLPVRDAVDTRLILDVRNRTGRIIDSQKQVGGWPDYRSAEPPADSDQDGMPDTWESSHELDPEDPTDNSKDRNGDGYSNIEEYLNSFCTQQ